MDNAILDHSKTVIHDLDYLLTQLQNRPKFSSPSTTSVELNPPFPEATAAFSYSTNPNRSFTASENQSRYSTTSSKVLELLSDIELHRGATQYPAPASRSIQYNSIKRSPPGPPPHDLSNLPRHTYDLLRNGTRKSPEDIKSRNAYLSLSPTQLSKESKTNVENLLAELNSALKFPRSEVESIETNIMNDDSFKNFSQLNLSPPISQTKTHSSPFSSDNNRYNSNRGENHFARVSSNNNNSCQHLSQPVTCDEEDIYSFIPETSPMKIRFGSPKNGEKEDEYLDEMLGKLETDLKIREARQAENNRRLRVSEQMIGRVVPTSLSTHQKMKDNSTGFKSASIIFPADISRITTEDQNNYESTIYEDRNPAMAGETAPLKCFQCNEIIIEHSIHALGRDWHPEHFTCTVCGCEIGTGNFFEYEELPFCEKDYHEKFSPKCASCQEPILEKCVTALDQTWHPEHFRCAGSCGRVFDPGEPYHVISQADLIQQQNKADNDGEANKSISQTSLDSIRAQIRFSDPNHKLNKISCKDGDGDKVETTLMPITNNTTRPSSSDDAFTHETYEISSNSLSEKVYAFCREDYFALFAPKCRACLNPILENFISALDSKWHPDCFVCHDCHMPFGKGSFYEYRIPPPTSNSPSRPISGRPRSYNKDDGQDEGAEDSPLFESWPLCQTHYEARRTGSSVCFGCGREIVPGSKSVVTALYKKFHPEHFVCAFCLKQLTSTFKERKGKPYCHGCFDKLMM